MHSDIELIRLPAQIHMAFSFPLLKRKVQQGSSVLGRLSNVEERRASTLSVYSPVQITDIFLCLHCLQRRAELQLRFPHWSGGATGVPNTPKKTVPRFYA